MKKILVLFAHPALHKSRVNSLLIRVYNEFDNITFHDLYDVYPEFMIDEQHEQSLLVKHDIIIFHHPIYWYSSPAIIKQWQDIVLEKGFAFGLGGDALKDKKMLSVLTTGTSYNCYKQGKLNNHRLRDFLLPFEQTAKFCDMHYLPPFVIHDVFKIKKDKEQLRTTITEFRLFVKTLSQEKLDINELNKNDYFNSYTNQAENHYKENS